MMRNGMRNSVLWYEKQRSTHSGRACAKSSEPAMKSFSGPVPIVLRRAGYLLFFVCSDTWLKGIIMTLATRVPNHRIHKMPNMIGLNNETAGYVRSFDIRKSEDCILEGTLSHGEQTTIIQNIPDKGQLQLFCILRHGIYE